MMTRSVIRLGWLLVGWTTFVWGSRVRNLLSDDGLTGFSFGWRLGAAVAFLGAAALGAFVLLRPRSFGRRVLAGWSVAGIGWWSIRGVGTLFGDFTVAFKAVHTVLALVTIGLGTLILLQLRTLNRTADDDPSLGHRVFTR